MTPGPFREGPSQANGRSLSLSLYTFITYLHRIFLWFYESMSEGPSEHIEFRNMGHGPDKNRYCILLVLPCPRYEGGRLEVGSR